MAIISISVEESLTLIFESSNLCSFSHLPNVIIINSTEITYTHKYLQVWRRIKTDTQTDSLAYKNTHASRRARFIHANLRGYISHPYALWHTCTYLSIIIMYSVHMLFSCCSLVLYSLFLINTHLRIQLLTTVSGHCQASFLKKCFPWVLLC